MRTPEQQAQYEQNLALQRARGASFAEIEQEMLDQELLDRLVAITLQTRKEAQQLELPFVVAYWDGYLSRFD